jgi:hypothetical protein
MAEKERRSGGFLIGNTYNIFGVVKRGYFPQIRGYNNSMKNQMNILREIRKPIAKPNQSHRSVKDYTRKRKHRLKDID